MWVVILSKKFGENANEYIQVESVIYDLGQRMPLEEVLELPAQDQWSTDDLLSTFAIERGKICR